VFSAISIRIWLLFTGLLGAAGIFAVAPPLYAVSDRGNSGKRFFIIGIIWILPHQGSSENTLMPWDLPSPDVRQGFFLRDIAALKL
jgi:hypothetical protein